MSKANKNLEEIKSLTNDYIITKDIDIIGDIYILIKPLLRSYLFKLVDSKFKNDEYIGELISLTFLRVITHIDTYNPDYNISTWIFTIARNVFFNEKKKNSRFINESTLNMKNNESDDYFIGILENEDSRIDDFLLERGIPEIEIEENLEIFNNIFNDTVDYIRNLDGLEGEVMNLIYLSDERMTHLDILIEINNRGTYLSESMLKRIISKTKKNSKKFIMDKYGEENYIESLMFFKD